MILLNFYGKILLRSENDLWLIFRTVYFWLYLPTTDGSIYILYVDGAQRIFFHFHSNFVYRVIYRPFRKQTKEKTVGVTFYGKMAAKGSFCAKSLASSKPPTIATGNLTYGYGWQGRIATLSSIT